LGDGSGLPDHVTPRSALERASRPLVADFAQTPLRMARFAAWVGVAIAALAVHRVAADGSAGEEDGEHDTRLPRVRSSHMHDVTPDTLDAFVASHPAVLVEL